MNFKGFLIGFICALLLIALGLGLALLVVDQGGLSMTATTKPLRIEAWLGNLSVNGWVANNAPNEKNPFPASTEVLNDASKEYVEHCAMCHGDAEHKTSILKGGLYPMVPQFMQKPPDGPDSHLFYVIKHGIRFSAMPAWGKVMPDDEIWKLVTFVEHANQLPPDVQQNFQQESAKNGGS